MISSPYYHLKEDYRKLMGEYQFDWSKLPKLMKDPFINWGKNLLFLHLISLMRI